MKIAVVPGHTPKRPGAFYEGLAEYPVVELLARMIAQKSPDCEVIHRPQKLTRKKSLEALVDRLNEGGFSAILSLHLNAAVPESPNRSYALHWPGSDDGLRFANLVSEYVKLRDVQRIGPRDGGHLYVIRETESPCIIDEVGYLDRSDHRRKILRNLDNLALYYAHAAEMYRNGRC